MIGIVRGLRPLLLLGLIPATIAVGQSTPKGDDRVERAAVRSEVERYPVRPRPDAADPSRRGASSGSWWFGPVGAIVVLGALGAASLVVRRKGLAPGADATAPKVVGRAALTPRQAVHLVRIGGRVLIVGTGPQGAPNLLGELDPDEAVAYRAVDSASRPGLAIRSGGRTA